MCVIIFSVIQFFGTISAETHADFDLPVGAKSLGPVRPLGVGAVTPKPTQPQLTATPESALPQEPSPDLPAQSNNAHHSAQATDIPISSGMIKADTHQIEMNFRQWSYLHYGTSPNLGSMR